MIKNQNRVTVLVLAGLLLIVGLFIAVMSLIYVPHTPRNLARVILRFLVDVISCVFLLGTIRRDGLDKRSVQILGGLLVGVMGAYIVVRFW